MKKELKKYLTYIRDIDKEDKIKDKEKVLEELIKQIEFTQHERLIHLIVTVFVGLSTLILLGLGMIIESISFIIVSLITLVFLIPP